MSVALVHWCHGAGGTVYLLARAHLTWGGDAYLTSILRAGECVWSRGLLKKGNFTNTYIVYQE
jgi:hypothetical protein